VGVAGHPGSCRAGRRCGKAPTPASLPGDGEDQGASRSELLGEAGGAEPQPTEVAGRGGAGWTAGARMTEGAGRSLRLRAREIELGGEFGECWRMAAHGWSAPTENEENSPHKIWAYMGRLD
jgi:hypothetical protein